MINDNSIATLNINESLYTLNLSTYNVVKCTAQNRSVTQIDYRIPSIHSQKSVYSLTRFRNILINVELLQQRIVKGMSFERKAFVVSKLCTSAQH